MTTRANPGEDAGSRMHARAAELFPICRSITGEGTRATLRRIASWIPLTIHEAPSGTAAFDWTVPDEWNVREAWIKTPQGTKIADLRDSNLHLLGYSMPVRTRIMLAELRKHLYTLPDRPDCIPYRTSYYEKRWGFCLRHETLLALPEGEYEVCIDATLEPGSLSYGECVVPGTSTDEVLVSTHVCHPSLANDNLSGIVVAAALAEAVAESPRRYTYRFLFLPGTIGPITWLARNGDIVPRIRHGLVLACVGDAGPPTYKRSRHGRREIDRAVEHVLRMENRGHRVRDFSPYGYDERQYGSPGFDLPVGCFMRTPYGEYPEYHTSADNLDLIRPEALEESMVLCRSVFNVLEGNRAYLNLNPLCEPQLGRRGLYDTVGGNPPTSEERSAILWVLNQSDGSNSLLDIAERAGLPFATVRRAAAVLEDHDLLRAAESGDDEICRGRQT